MQRPPDDMARELEKILDAVKPVHRALWATAEHDAAMHLNPTIRANPATINLGIAVDDLERLITELKEP